MKKVYLILVAICLFLSCTEQKDVDMDIYGISFTCPAGWKITKTLDLETAWLVVIQKKGFSSSGLVTMSFTENDFELDELLAFYQEELAQQRTFKNIAFQPVEAAYYGKYQGISSSFTVSVLGLEHQGKIYVFEENGITMSIVHQEAVEDYKKNLSGFEIIKNSLTL